MLEKGYAAAHDVVRGVHGDGRVCPYLPFEVKSKTCLDPVQLTQTSTEPLKDAM